MRDGPFVVYGPTGLTGELVVREAVRRGHRPVLAGRRGAPALAAELGLESVAVSLDDRDALVALARRASVVLHAAGPYGDTAGPMIDACLAAGTPYVDLAGEVDALERLLARDAEARAAGVPLVGGAGFGVSIGECAALLAARSIPDPQRLWIGVHADNAGQSAGALVSTLEVLSGGGAWVEGGVLRRGRLAHTRFTGEARGEPLAMVAAPLAEGLAAHRSTGVRDVVAGIVASPATALGLRTFGPGLSWVARRGWVRRWARGRTTGRSAPDDQPRRSFAWARAEGAGGSRSCLVEAGEGYAVAAQVMVRAAERIGGLAGGAYTPGMAFGPSLVAELDGVTVVEGA